MAKRAREQVGRTRDQWVPSDMDTSGAKDVTPEPPGNSGDTDEWLAIPRPRTLGTFGDDTVRAHGNGHGAEVDAAPTQPSSPKRRRLPKRASTRERWLISRLRRAKQNVEDQQEEIDRLKDEIKELRATGQPQPTKPRPAARAKPAGQPRTTRSQANPPPATRRMPASDRATAGPSSPVRKVDLQQASFEDLRGLGLSVTQAARLIAYREAGAGFDSVDDLAAIPGFGKGTISKLHERARVGRR
jgi:DNA uptake protein ComE-like DNA-binding protein